MELGREAIRAPLGRPLLRVSQQGSIDELLLGQHGLFIGMRRCRTSVRAAQTSGTLTEHGHRPAAQLIDIVAEYASPSRTGERSSAGWISHSAPSI